MTNELFYIFTLLQVADVFTTHRVLKNGGVELNPLLARLFTKFGHMQTLVVAKTLLLVLIWNIYYDIPEWVMVVLIALYVAVVVNNIRVIKSQKTI